MIPGKGKVTNVINDFGKSTLERVKEEGNNFQEELEKQLGVSPSVVEDDQKNKEALQEKKKQKEKEAKKRENIRDLEGKLTEARKQIEKERKEKEKIRNQLAENEERKPVVQGLPADNTAAENYPPEPEQVPLPPSRPRRGIFPPGAEKFKKKE